MFGSDFRREFDYDPSHICRYHELASNCCLPNGVSPIGQGHQRCLLGSYPLNFCLEGRFVLGWLLQLCVLYLLLSGPWFHSFLSKTIYVFWSSPSTKALSVILGAFITVLLLLLLMNLSIFNAISSHPVLNAISGIIMNDLLLPWMLMMVMYRP